MKAFLGNTQRQYWKYTENSWVQPLLYSNGTMGGNNFAVYRYNEAGGYRGGDAWQAFATASGYGGYWTGNYRDEAWSALNLVMYVPLLVKVTGYSVYIPTVDSAMNWGSCKATQFYGSNDGSNWVQLYSTGHIGQDAQLYFYFTNNNRYKYYRFRYETYGSGHKDYIAICSFRLFATYQAIEPATADNYDFYKDIQTYKIRYQNGKYYTLGD